METMSCPLCARPRTAADERGLAWSSVHERDGSVCWLCPDCTRSRLAEIETFGVPARPRPQLVRTLDRNAGKIGKVDGASGNRSTRAAATVLPSSAVAGSLAEPAAEAS
jgi:hypothetical protein